MFSITMQHEMQHEFLLQNSDFETFCNAISITNAVNTIVPVAILISDGVKSLLFLNRNFFYM